jgi:endonuclease/exonuclease/phosphatase (EEP) superfamily protein YafD
MVARKLIRAEMMLAGSAYVLGLTGYILLNLLAGDRFWWLAFLNNFTPLYFVPLLIIVPLMWLYRLRRLLRLNLTLVLIGLLWFGPYFLPRFSTHADGPTLRVLTFNAYGRNQQRDRVEAWLRQVHADIVLLQEIPESYGGNGIATLRDIYPYQFTQASPMHWWGNVTLSRFPFTETDKPSMENLDQPYRQRVVINYQGQPVAIFNVHLNFPARKVPRLASLAEKLGDSFLTNALSYDPSERDIQIAELRVLLDREPYPYLIAGDFNTSDQTGMYRTLVAYMGDTFREAGWGFGWSWPVAGEVELPAFVPPLIRIDYIWHSKQWRAVTAAQGPELGSDHLPLYATLELQRNK